MAGILKQCPFLELERIGRLKSLEFYVGIVKEKKQLVYTNKEKGLISTRKAIL